MAQNPGKNHQPQARRLPEQVPVQDSLFILVPMSCKEEQEQTQSHSKRWKWIAMCCACHQQHYHELPSGGSPMTIERESDRKKHGGGQWRQR